MLDLVRNNEERISHDTPHFKTTIKPIFIVLRYINSCCRQLVDSLLGIMLMWFLMHDFRTHHIAHVSLAWAEVGLLATVKFLNFEMPENFAGICLKFKQTVQTLGYFVKKMQME